MAGSQWTRIWLFRKRNEWNGFTPVRWTTLWAMVSKCHRGGDKGAKITIFSAGFSFVAKAWENFLPEKGFFWPNEEKNRPIEWKILRSWYSFSLSLSLPSNILIFRRLAKKVHSCEYGKRRQRICLMVSNKNLPLYSFFDRKSSTIGFSSRL